MGLPTTDEAIRAAEDELGRRLPPALRDRLLKNNGGDIVVGLSGEEDEHWELHPLWDPADRDTMRRSASHLVAEQGSAREWPGFPSNAVAIAQQDGDQLVLLPGEDDPQLWFHETGDLERVEVVWDP
jgi:SMI1 / KNR4 family (SUKH-1)